jgi:hypothetical protein
MERRTQRGLTNRACIMDENQAFSFVLNVVLSHNRRGKRNELQRAGRFCT